MVLVLTAIAVVTQERARVDLQPGRPRLLRGALRLRLAGQQQRQRVRGLRRDRVLGAHGHDRALARPPRAADRGARARRHARGEEDTPASRRGRSAPTAARSPSCSSGIIILTAGLMIFPALDARADRGGAVVTRLVAPLGACRRRLDGRARARLPARDDRVRPRRLPEQVERQPDRAQRPGRRLEAGRRRSSRARATSTRARRRRRPRTTRPRRRFANLGPTNPDLAKNVRAAALAILKLERPYNPGLTGRRHPRRRGHDLGIRASTPTSRRPYARLQARAHRRGARAVGRPGAAAHRPEHGRPLARLPRRARRQRPEAQPRARQGGGMSRAQRVALHAGDHRSRRSRTRSSSSTRASSSTTRSSSSSSSAR